MSTPPPLTHSSRRRGRRTVLPAALAALAVALSACGGGTEGGGDGGNGGNGGNGGPIGGCYYQYTLTPVPVLTGLDPLLAQQWHLVNNGQGGSTPGEDLRVSGVWSAGNKGDGVRVAVIDDAIETVHEDLAPNVAPNASFDYRSGTATAPLPCAVDDDHGTAVAGIIAARDGNAVGGAGVAPRASLAGYNALGTGTDADIADALRRDSAITGVYNNSWGSADNGLLHRVSTSFINAIEAGITNGRDGKGSIFVFPSGNGGCYIGNGSGGCAYSDNSNYDAYVNQRGVIAVCAVGDDGRAPTYSEAGANVLVCGPSGGSRRGVTTTDVSNGYRSDFAGTSASTPMVSGVVALMLKENPALTWRDVRLILARTARKNDATDAGWVSGNGLSFNPKYGFGVADAAAAVTVARGWNSVGGTAQLSRCQYTRGPGNGFPIALPDMQGQTLSPSQDSIDASACPITRIEFIEVSFSATHTYSGDLRIELISPNNLISPLAGERLCSTDGDALADDCGDYDNWNFGSVRHLDEAAAGVWRLRVTDAQAGDTGQWTSWRLTLWGR
ncbi:MAG: S8 family serine peptidase [Burkholderiaceae bacterium]